MIYCFFSRHLATHPAGAKYADTVAIGIDPDGHKLACVYNDHSMYLWDVKDLRKVGKSRSFLYHSSCIWGLDVSAVSIAYS